MSFYCPTCEASDTAQHLYRETYGGRTEFTCANDPSHGVRLIPVNRLAELSRQVMESNKPTEAQLIAQAIQAREPEPDDTCPHCYAPPGNHHVSCPEYRDAA
jgi:hypothetical protein